MENIAEKINKIVADFCIWALCALHIIKRESNEIQIPIFEIGPNPTIQFSEIRSRNFYIRDRENLRMAADIQAEEDRRIFRAYGTVTDSTFLDVSIVSEPTDPVARIRVDVTPHFTIIGFKPSKEEIFTYPYAIEKNVFTIYGIKGISS